jgi:hypothetical protein
MKNVEMQCHIHFNPIEDHMNQGIFDSTTTKADGSKKFRHE